MIRALVVGLLGWVLLLCPATAAAAQTDPVFDPEDAQDLADLLADATEAQGICYGWIVQVYDSGTGLNQQSTGSNFGPQRSLDNAVGAVVSCRSRVEFTADITYTSSSSESEDSASWSVTSMPDGPDTGDLNRLQLFDENDLVGEDVDAAVARAVAALPQLAAESGIAPALTAAPASSTPPDVGSLADDPGSDYLRRAGGLLGFGAVLLLGGIAFGLFALRSSRTRKSPSRQPPQPAPPQWPQTPPQTPPPPQDPPPPQTPPPRQDPPPQH